MRNNYAEFREARYYCEECDTYRNMLSYVGEHLRCPCSDYEDDDE